MGIKMAFNKEFLSQLGIPEELHDEILQHHNETVETLTAEREKAMKDIEKLPGLLAEIAEIKGYKDKYTAALEELEQLKKEDAYRQFLRETGVKQQYIEKVIRADAEVIANMKMSGDLILGADMLADDVKRNWGLFMDQNRIRESVSPPVPSKCDRASAAAFREKVNAILDE